MARGRPKKEVARKRVTFTTLPKIIAYIDAEREYISRSEFIHRALVDSHNKKHPDDKIRYWKPENGK